MRSCFFIPAAPSTLSSRGQGVELLDGHLLEVGEVAGACGALGGRSARFGRRARSLLGSVFLFSFHQFLPAGTAAAASTIVLQSSSMPSPLSALTAQHRPGGPAEALRELPRAGL